MENLLAPSNIKILLAYQESGMRASLIALLKGFGFRIFYEANDGLEALAILEDYVPHVIILDIEMPRMNGFELMHNVRNKYPFIKMIVLSKYTGYFTKKSFTFDLADALLSKNFKPEELVVMVTTLALDRKLPRSYRHDLMSEKDMANARLLSNQTCLSSKEIEVLKLICEDKTTKEIADILGLTVKTIEFHRTNIYKKTNTNSLLALYKYAVKHHFTHFE